MFHPQLEAALDCYKTGVFVAPPSKNDFDTVNAGGATDEFLEGSVAHLVRRPDRYEHFMKRARDSARVGAKQLDPSPRPRAQTPPPSRMIADSSSPVRPGDSDVD